MITTRALDEVEAERVRDRVLALLEKLGTQQKVGDYVGVSQQTIGKVQARKQIPSYYLACKIADADHVGVDALLSGVPVALYEAIGARRWPEHVVAAVSKLSLMMPRASGFDVSNWTDVLRRTEDALAEVIRSTPYARR